MIDAMHGVNSLQPGDAALAIDTSFRQLSGVADPVRVFVSPAWDDLR